ncbi:MAG: hypothetical protein V3T47_09495, partial [Gammaproteobacteria bacterium]
MTRVQRHHGQILDRLGFILPCVVVGIVRDDEGVEGFRRIGTSTGKFRHEVFDVSIPTLFSEIDTGRGHHVQ